MTNYSAYGLTVRSPFPLTEFLPSSSSHFDVSVEYGADPEWLHAVADKLDHFEICKQEGRFWFKGVGSFVVQGNGTRIVISPQGADESLLRLYIEGMMMAMCLHQRGFCVLHASVVEICGEAVAILGPMGAGKSSVAASLYARGHNIVSDDNAAILSDGEIPVVLSAYPRVKLFPEIASALGFTAEARTVLHSSQIKVGCAIDDRFTPRSVPLSKLYILERREARDIFPISPMQTVIELIRNVVPTRWGYPGDANQLLKCGALARRVPAFTVKTFSNLGSLPALAADLEQHAIISSSRGGTHIREDAQAKEAVFV